MGSLSIIWPPSANLPARSQIDEIIISIAGLLKELPAAFYRLNSLFHPYARVEFDLRRTPITSFVIKISGSSRIVVLDPPQGNPAIFRGLTAPRLRDILIKRNLGDHIYDELHVVEDDALCDCLAELVQDVGLTSASSQHFTRAYTTSDFRQSYFGHSSERGSQVLATAR